MDLYSSRRHNYHNTSRLGHLDDELMKVCGLLDCFMCNDSYGPKVRDCLNNIKTITGYYDRQKYTEKDYVTLELYTHIIKKNIYTKMYEAFGCVTHDRYFRSLEYKHLNKPCVEQIEKRLLKKYNKNIRYYHLHTFTNIDEIYQYVAYKILKNDYEENKSDEYTVLNSNYYKTLENDVAKLIKYYKLER